MKLSTKTTLVFLAIFCPIFCFAQSEATGLHFKAEVLAFINLIILVTSLICIKQYIWPSDINYSPFHLINILMIVTFYSIGLWFLISHRRVYEGYENLTPMMCIVKFFFSPDIDSLKQWVIAAALVINVLYIVRKTRSII